MPIYDYCCYKCDYTWEVIEEFDANHVLRCPNCKWAGRRVISVRGVNCINEDAGWIRSVLEVVPKDSENPVEREFYRNPTRSNMIAWMKERGLRNLEPGEKPARPKPVDISSVTETLMKRHIDRNRLEVRSHASED